MQQIRLDPETAHRMLDGSVAPEDAPPGYAGVAALLTSASDTSRTEPVREAATVAAMHAAVLKRLETPILDPRRKHVRMKSLATKTAAASTVVLLGAGAAVAATGSLSGAAHHTASVSGTTNHHANARGHSSGSATNGTTGGTSHTANGPGNTSNAGASNRQGHGPNPNAFPGLCRAKIASNHHPDVNSVVAHINCSGITAAGAGSGTHSNHSSPAAGPSSTPHGPPSSTPASGTGTPGTGKGSTGPGTASGHSASKGNTSSRP